MNRYIENLKSFLAEQSATFRFDDAKSVIGYTLLLLLLYKHCGHRYHSLSIQKTQ